MKTSKTPKQRQKTRRDNLKLAGIIRMTVEMDRTTAQILRSIAIEHGRTHSDVIQLGIKMARRALQEAEARPSPRSASAAPVAPKGALASLTAQLEELKAAQALEENLPALSAAEARAVRLGLTGEVRA